MLISKKNLRSTVFIPLATHKSLVIYWIAVVLSNITNWVFSRIIVSTLPLEEYALVSLLVSFQLVLSIIAIVLLNATNKQVALELKEDNKFSGSQQLKLLSILLSVGFLVSFLIANPLLQNLLHYPSDFFYIVSIIITILVIFPLAWGRGVLNAYQAYILAGILYLFEGILKVGLGLLTSLGAEYHQLAYLANPISLLVSFVVLYAALKNKNIKLIRLPSFSRKKLISLFPFILGLLILNLGSILPLSLDIILVRAFSSETVSVQYPLLNLVGKTEYFVLSSLTGVLIPILSTRIAAGQKSHKIIYAISGGIIVTSVIGALLVYNFPSLFLPIIVGNKYTFIQHASSIYVLAVGFLSVCVAIATFETMHERNSYSYILILGILIQFVFFMFFNSSLEQIALGMLVTYFGLFCVFVLHYFISRQFYSRFMFRFSLEKLFKLK